MAKVEIQNSTRERAAELLDSFSGPELRLLVAVLEQARQSHNVTMELAARYRNLYRFLDRVPGVTIPDDCKIAGEDPGSADLRPIEQVASPGWIQRVKNLISQQVANVNSRRGNIRTGNRRSSRVV